MSVRLKRHDGIDGRRGQTQEEEEDEGAVKGFPRHTSFFCLKHSETNLKPSVTMNIIVEGHCYGNVEMFS